MSGGVSVTAGTGLPPFTTDPLGRATTQFIDAGGRRLRATDPVGRETRWTVDKLNRVANRDRPARGLTSFDYDPNGNVLSLTDALNHATSYTYDTSDRVKTRKDPLTHEARYDYDGNNNLTQVTDRKSQVTGYAYDALDRVSQVTFDDGSTITYTYDAGDRLWQVDDSVNGSIVRDYDGLDRLTLETTAQGSVTYTYYADGRRESMTVTGQPTVTYGYDDVHRLTSVTQGTQMVALTYDDADRRHTLTLPNGIVTTYTWDAASQLTGLTYTNGNATLGTLTYTYDTAGNRTSVGGTWARTGLPQPISATYDDANRLATWGGTTVTYDLNGNLANDGTTTYTWNARNQLAGVSGGASASFAYDGMGRRRGKTIAGRTTNFLYDELNFVQEQTSGGAATANLLTGLDVDETFTRTDAAGTSSFLVEALGSPLELADASGTLQTHYTFEPFGATSVSGATNTSAVQFTGRENDGSGLYSYRARYYNPGLQRFLSEDPIGLLGGFNLFVYAANYPTGYRDPLGLQVRTPAQGQPPNSTQWHPNPDGSWTRRYFGDDGRAQQDLDFGQQHGNDPEVHPWDWTKTPPRQPGQPYPKELPPWEPPAPAFPFPWRLPLLLPPWMLPIVNPCLLEPTLCMPRPSKTWALNFPAHDEEVGAPAHKPLPADVPGKWRDSQRANG